jgi:hypothetical protein
VEKHSSLAQVKFFSGTLQEVEGALNAFYLQKNFSLEEAKKNTVLLGSNLVAVFYTEKNPAG